MFGFFLGESEHDFSEIAFRKFCGHVTIEIIRGTFTFHRHDQGILIGNIVGRVDLDQVVGDFQIQHFLFRRQFVFASGDQVVESRYYRLPVSGEDGAALEAERLGAWLSDPLFVEKLPGGVLPTVWLQGTPVSESFRAGLREALGVSVEIFRPPVQATGEGGGDAGFGPAFGLALLGLDGSNRGLELSEERKEGFEEGPKYGATAALAALLVLVVLGTLGLRGLQHHRHLSGIEEEIAAMKEEKAAVEQLSLAVRTKRSRLEFITANLNKVRQADLLWEMTLLIPDDTYLSEYTFRDGRIEISGLSPSASRSASTWRKRVARKLSSREKMALGAAGLAVILFVFGRWAAVPFFRFLSGAPERVESRLTVLRG